LLLVQSLEAVIIFDNDLGVIGSAGSYTIDTIGSDFDTEIGIWNSSGVLLSADDDGVSGTLQSMITIDLTDGVYFVGLSEFSSQFQDGFTNTGSALDSGDLFISTLNINSSSGSGQGIALLQFDAGGDSDLETAGFFFEVASVPESFSVWIASFGLTGDDALPTADTVDGDGLANIVEFWFGTSPVERDIGLSVVSANQLDFTFSHPQNEDLPVDVFGSYEWSLNLIDWYQSDGVDGPVNGPTVTAVPTTVGSITSVVATASEELNEVFIRVVVEQG